MTLTQQEAAQVCRQKLIGLIGEPRFELWFSADHAISVANDKLIIAAENDFSRDIIKKNFQAELRRLAKHEIGEEAWVEYVVDTGLNKDASPLTEHAEFLEYDPGKCEKVQPVSANASANNGLQLQPTGKKVTATELEKKNQRQTDKKSGATSQNTQQTCYNLPLAKQDVADSTELPPSKSQRSFTSRAFQVIEQPELEQGTLSKSATSTIDSNRKPERRWESLSSFVVDSRNKVAATSAAQIVQNIGEITPLFISGPTGSGKTHLLEGTFRAARGKVRSGRVLYMSSDQYTNQFLAALHQRSMPIFRQRFQDLDVFLLDDIQFFHNKRATVVELVQMIDNMVRHGKQLILSADRTLAELDFLGAELITRISSGLICRVDYPSMEARKQIITQQANERNLKLEPVVVDLVAERIVGDLRNIRGAINRLQAYQFATGDPINYENACDWLQDIFQAASKIPSMKEIEDEVCKLFGLEHAMLRSDKKARSISQPRMLAMWLSRKYTRAALSEIGDFFGGRSHSTVVSARNKVTNWVKDGQRLQTSKGEVTAEDAIRRIETRLHVG